MTVAGTPVPHQASLEPPSSHDFALCPCGEPTLNEPKPEEVAQCIPCAAQERNQTFKVLEPDTEPTIEEIRTRDQSLDALLRSALREHPMCSSPAAANPAFQVAPGITEEDVHRAIQAAQVSKYSDYPLPVVSPQVAEYWSQYWTQPESMEP